MPGTDGATDAGGDVDAGGDAGMAGTDGGTDAGGDVDACGDAGVAGTDGATDAGRDVDAGGDAGMPGTDGATDAGGSTCNPACTQQPGCPARSCWTASASPNNQQASLAIDGNDNSRWATGAAQKGNEWLEVDLCQAMSVIGVNVYTAGGTDEAASYTVVVSTDGVTWQTVLTSTTTAQSRMALTFDAVTARYVRMNQTGQKGFWWSVNEFSVACR
jgi:hypothetical protein